MESQEEIKRKRISLGVSIGIHALLIIIFIFILAWKEPYPPIPSYGIELNFGLEDVGSGDIQPIQESTATADEQTESETAVDEEIIEEPEEPIEENVVETDETIQEVETETQEIIEDSEMEDSPDVIDPPTENPEPQNEKDIEKQQEEIIEPVLPSVETTPEAESGQEEMKEESMSHGDDVEKEGDKGSPTGELDARALYGTPGGGGGASLDLAGWVWDYIPKPHDTSDEFGRIVFEIKVDDQGDVIGVRTLEKTVSPKVEQIYRKEVESLTFSPTSENTIPAPLSTGKIIFFIEGK
jgi:outer membrane biosynthesis protein TonB